MNKRIPVSLFLVLGLIALTSGCASKQKKDVRVLQAQVGAITDELVRMDSALQDTRAALQAEQNRKAALESALAQSDARVGALKEEEDVLRRMYRTPSGFELPAAQIQQALKNAGYYRGAIDGKIGSGTRDAIKAFQRDQGLTADGVVGQGTWSKLKAYLNVK